VSVTNVYDATLTCNRWSVSLNKSQRQPRQLSFFFYLLLLFFAELLLLASKQARDTMCEMYHLFLPLCVLCYDANARRAAKWVLYDNISAAEDNNALLTLLFLHVIVTLRTQALNCFVWINCLFLYLYWY
jgi:hypothetical protein